VAEVEAEVDDADGRRRQVACVLNALKLAAISDAIGEVARTLGLRPSTWRGSSDPRAPCLVRRRRCSSSSERSAAGCEAARRAFGRAGRSRPAGSRWSGGAGACSAGGCRRGRTSLARASKMRAARWREPARSGRPSAGADPLPLQ